MKKVIIITFAAVIVFTAAVAAFVFYLYPYVLEPARDRSEAVRLYNEGEYVLAALRFDMISGYDDKAKEAWLKAGDESFEAGELSKARTYYLKGGADSSVFDALNAAYYERGVTAYADNDRIEGENCFSCITYGSGYAKLLDPVRFSCGERLLNAGDLESAEKVFLLCGDMQKNAISNLWMERGKQYLAAYDLSNASVCFARAIGYADDSEAVLHLVDQCWRDAGDSARQSGDQTLADKCYAHISTGR